MIGNAQMTYEKEDWEKIEAASCTCIPGDWLANREEE